MKWIALRLIIGCLVGFFAYGPRVFASPNTETFRSGIHISRDQLLRSKQLITILKGLQFWTGLNEIAVDSNGDLVLGNRTSITGGSKTARELIIAAIDGGDSFTLVRRDNSPTIAFAQIESIYRYIDAAGGRHSAWEVRLDFSDFRQLTGRSEVRAAFDPAINVVHELAHAVRGYFDPIQEGDPLGDCERYINEMRLELGLPQRLHYYPKRSVLTGYNGSAFVRGEIMFRETNAKNGKEEELVLTFSLEKIFDLSRARPKSTVQADLLVQKRSKVSSSPEK